MQRKLELEAIRIDTGKLKGTMIHVRSRAKWIEDWENPAAIFVSRRKEII